MSAIAEVTFSRQVALKALLALEIGHPLAQQAFSVGRKLLAPGAGKRITLFTGPPGWGKSWLRDKLHAVCVNDAGAVTHQFPHAKPSVCIEASESGGGGFSWEEVYDDIVGHDLRRPRIGSLPLPWELIDPATQPQGNRVSKKKSAAIKKLKHDHTQQLLIDEIAHLLVDGSPKNVASAARALKSFSNQAILKIALFCSYDGLNLLSIDTQLTRRIQLVELRPYDSMNADDQRCFFNVVLTIGRNLGLDDGELQVRCEVLMERTDGAIGALVGTFEQSLALLDDNKPFSYALLDECMPSRQWAEQVRKENLDARARLGELR